MLLNLQVLIEAGRGADPRLAPGLELVLAKQNAQGRWLMEYSYQGKLWQDVEAKGAPSKWVTLRAMRVLSGAA